jgi:hypothetical protein
MKNACFISYCHGERELMTTFINQLKSALESSLEPYMDERVVIDTTRLAAGYNYNEALAEAICQSICMVAVLVPKYFEHAYCRRELEAMKRIETERFNLLGTAATHGRGLIIPIILRGEITDLPPAIKDHIHCADFSKFTTAYPPLATTDKFVQDIERIARFIYEMRKQFRRRLLNPSRDCSRFVLPGEAETNAWMPWEESPADPQPLREAGR